MLENYLILENQWCDCKFKVTNLFLLFCIELYLLVSLAFTVKVRWLIEIS